MTVMLALVAAGPLAAQRGTITGTVTARDSNQPVPGVQVYLQGTSFGQLTQANGRYAITNVPPGVYTVIAQSLGYAEGRQENVRIRAETPTVTDFSLAITALRLEQVVATGTIDPTAGVKVPFTVGRLTKEDLAVPASAPAAALQGKMAGVMVVSGSGQPGDQPSILLRGFKSIYRGNSPLIVVDGVITGSTLGDIDAQDIETLEVIKGAAAASMYGSRAGAGVIAITTKRGRDIPENSTRISLRSEYGMNSLPIRHDYITRHHHYLVDPVKGWVDAAGNAVTKDKRVIAADQIADNPYPGPLYDHIDLYFNPGNYVRNNLSISQNSLSTNFSASFTHNGDAGVVPGNDGARLLGLRMNLDHRLRSDVMFSVSTYYSKFQQEQFAGDPFYDLMFMPPDVDLKATGPDGQLIIQPDPFTLQENPLYSVQNSDSWAYRSRFMGSGVLRYSPATWFSLEGSFAYDRSDRNSDSFTPVGYKSGINSVSTGSVSRSHNRTVAWNGGVTASFLHSVGDLTLRAKTQYLLEAEENDSRSAGGSTLSVIGVPQVNVGTSKSASSSYQEEKSSGVFLIGGLDYAGKYVLDGLVRRDGSSLFGSENRWHTYYRASGAWLLSQEPWWGIEPVSLFKLRYSIGTAGGRPNFGDRFETWSVSSTGVPSKGTLGNKALAPEKNTEHEAAIDLTFNNRYSLSIVNARSTVTDQLVSVPLAALYGYSSQWQNAGTVKSNTWEAEFEAVLASTRDFTWRAGIVADRSRSRITELNRACFRDEGLYYCPGTDFRTMYGYRFLRAANELPAAHANSQGAFAINDDGYLVPVGQGNTYRDGLAKNLWNTKIDIDGVSYDWGLPILQIDSTGGVATVEVGDGNADLNLGVSTNLQWKGFNVHALITSKIGGDVYNETRQWGYRDKTHADYDQSGKSDELKKPVNYYLRLYNTNNFNSHFVEEGTYTRLRELAVSYTFNRAQIQRLAAGMGIERLTL
ncbi:MAG TPA: SusC/RagA family TonB-linked outer membrane protein, partial [Longimicrobiales bacterium]|nr:SusC/RagA family TonB-linked outer membrane protein [Longimicrobiales bacterium]